MKVNRRVFEGIGTPNREGVRCRATLHDCACAHFSTYVGLPYRVLLGHIYFYFSISFEIHMIGLGLYICECFCYSLSTRRERERATNHSDHCSSGEIQ